MNLYEDKPQSEIADKLRTQLLEALRKHVAALAKFNDLVRSVTSGHPHPDASLIIQQAARESRAALRCYVRAINRSTDFMVHGILPIDLATEERPEDLKRRG